ncbi:MAG: tetratricopeptide repeat protein, partial [Balneolaceae bacterium]
MKINNFIQELKRRNVFRVATAYTIAGWIIIQVSDTVFPRLGLPEWTVTFIIAVVGIGFPIALIIAWAFELTPDGVHKSSEVDITESVTASTGKKLNGIIIASLGILVILLLSERIFFAESTIFETDAVNIENASIAVLPFVNMSADESNEYFSDGLSEELLNGLAKIEGMQVAARTSSFSFKGKNEDLRMVAEQLGVKHILEGSVRKDGDQIRITAQLIQADNGFHLWSETYDRELESIFAIQEEISRQVIQELKVRLLPEENVVLAFRPTEDIEAYNAFLEATQLESSRQPEDLEAAIVKYKQAINLDPSFALAHARLAKAYSHLFDYGDLAYESMIELMNDHINKALVINDQLGEAYLAKSMLESDMPNEDAPINTEIMARRADDLLPNNAEVINMIQIALRDQGKIDEADEYLLKAYRLDPLSSPITSNVAGMYRRDGEI